LYRKIGFAHPKLKFWVCISWFLAAQSEGKAWELAQAGLNWQETDSHHSVDAQSENSGMEKSTGVSQATPV